MTAMSPLARFINFPVVALATPDTGSFRSFEYKALVKVFLKTRLKRRALWRTKALRTRVKRQRRTTERRRGRERCEPPRESRKRLMR